MFVTSRHSEYFGCEGAKSVFKAVNGASRSVRVHFSLFSANGASHAEEPASTASSTPAHLPQRPVPRSPGAATAPLKSEGPVLHPLSSSASLTAATSPSSPGEPPLWCRLPSVVNSGVLDSLSSDQRKLRETLFEIISTEESYHNSLQLIERHFREPLRALSQKPTSTKENGQNSISGIEFRELFQNLDEVRRCSASFLTSLNNIPMDDLSGLCDIVQEHAKYHFYPYKVYCARKVQQDRRLQQLTKRSSPLAALIARLETSPEVRGLGLPALLHLPVQRVQRLPMMLAAVLKRMPLDHPERQSCEQANRALTELARDCDESAARGIGSMKSFQDNGTTDPFRVSRLRLSRRRWGVHRHGSDVGSLSLSIGKYTPLDW
ncbi:rho guanine nucleotide exchange factor 16-like isoform X2 [Amphibalanus amphitrite]|uniref:rho guanine nucleotide exchange factor 16-like isoform X2 n=1 Tax=Amphibalanus amphitrite TaxID=1232801 RepID=UPI001C905D78|nr:rho guanine nucleotide exchange factor 16-like isoform X2 [Amphibalanus amphitrite]